MNSPEEIKDFLLWTVPCALSCGRGHTIDSVSRAVSAGLTAARHGAAVPLAPLLDLEAFMGSQGMSFGSRIASPPRCMVYYDEWIGQLWDLIDQALFQRPRDENEAPAGRPDYVFLASAYWPKALHQSSIHAGWEEAYAMLERDCIGEIVMHWRHQRSRDVERWSELWLEDEPWNVASQLRAPALWTLYRWYSNEPQVQERFHHAVAQHYFAADDPELTPDQARRIRLLRRRERAQRLPVLQTPDEQDPDFGVIALSSLVKEPFEYVASSILNHWDSRLNKPPSISPPRTVHLHLCWTHGYRASNDEHRNLKFTPSRRRSIGEEPFPDPAAEETGAGSRSMAATLQSLVMLVLDDLRNALWGLPIRFHVHALGGMAGEDGGRSRSIQKLRPGRRWKDTAFRAGILPPGSAVHHFFRRENLADTGARQPGFRFPPEVKEQWIRGGSPQHWFCCFLVRDELAHEMGFEVEEFVARSSTATSMETWRAGGSCEPVPACMDHVMAISDGAGEGVFLESHGSIRKRGVLRSRVRSRPEVTRADPSFIHFRTEMLDVVINALDSRMLHS